MANPGLSLEQAEDAIRRVEEMLRAGFRPPGATGNGPGAIGAAAEKAVSEGIGNGVNTFITRVQSAKLRFNLEPDWSAYRPKVYSHRPSGAPVIPSQDHVVEDDPEGDPQDICGLGDPHDSPHIRDKSRFRWIGQYIAEHGFKRVVCAGDWWTMDSFSSHTDRATFEGFAKPTFEQDRESFHESQRAFQAGLAGHKVIKDVTLGNHEHRAYKYDNFHPDGVSHGLMMDEAWLQWGWRTTPYGQFRFIDSVGFIHTPLNGRGKPMAQSQRVNKATNWDIVHGDDHRSLMMSDYKIGPFRSPTVYSMATCLPPGYIEGFANQGASTWRSGVCSMTTWGGHIRRWNFEEMILLRRRYGRSGEGAPKSFSGWEKAANDRESTVKAA